MRQRHLREDKPAWAAVPRSVRAEAERLLGTTVLRAVRAYGGYGPSATFVLNLDDQRQVFFKGTYPLPEGSGVIWSLEEEERVYALLGDHIVPWAPAYYGTIRRQGWHALLIEAVAGDKVPPWTRSRAERATRSYAQFHAATLGRALPDWLSREQHLEFADFWAAIASDHASLDRLIALCPDADTQSHASEWIRTHAMRMSEAERPLEDARRFALLHFDTRSDNIRIDGEMLRIFDWPWACVGPPEFDFGAFAQSIAGEGGPDPEDLARTYSAVLPLDDALLTACVVGLAGYFADRGPRPDLPGLPRLRSVQRRQLKSSLRWAAVRLGLPKPEWLNAIAD